MIIEIPVIIISVHCVWNEKKFAMRINNVIKIRQCKKN